MRNPIKPRPISPEVLAMDSALRHSSGPITFADLPPAEGFPDPYYSLRMKNLPAAQPLLLIEGAHQGKRICGEQVMNAAPRGAHIVPVGNNGFAVIAPRNELEAMIGEALKKQMPGRGSGG